MCFPLREEDWLLYVGFLERDEKLKPGTIQQYLLHLGKFFACLHLPVPQWKQMKRLSILRRRTKGLAKAKATRKQPIHYKLAMEIVDIIDSSRDDTVAFVATLLIGICGILLTFYD